MKRKKKNKYYKLTKASLSKLDKEDIPSNIIITLASLENQRYETSEDFVIALEETIGVIDAAQYQALILKHATKYSKNHRKKEMTIPKYKLEKSKKIAISAHSGLFLLGEFIEQVELLESFGRFRIFQRQKITEAVHLMVLVINQFCGGDAISDTERIKNDQALRAILGDIHVPAPHTSGDFLERFTLEYVERLRDILHRFQNKMLRKLKKKLGNTITVSLDSSIYEIFGNTIQGSAMSHKSIFGYHPLLMHVNDTGELLDVYLREGNAYTSTDAIEMLRTNLTRLAEHFDEIILLADSGFFDQNIIDILRILENEFNKIYKRKIKIRFIITAKLNNPLQEKVSNNELLWEKYEKKEKETSQKRNSRTENYRLRNLRENLQKRNKSLKTRGPVEITDFIHKVPSWSKSYRFVFKRQEVFIENLSLQLELFEAENKTEMFYHGYVTNITDKSNTEIIGLIDGRGRQEKFIEDYKNGLGTVHIPTKHFCAN